MRTKSKHKQKFIRIVYCRRPNDASILAQYCFGVMAILIENLVRNSATALETEKCSQQMFTIYFEIGTQWSSTRQSI